MYLAPDAAAFDWIDAQIGQHRYYEQPGIWTLGVDLDKRVMAELIALLGPRDTIEIGCSSGSVMQCLVECGVDAHGIDISEYAKQHATAEVRERIHIGDVRTLRLDRAFDLGYGLDIFEHVNPTRSSDVLDAFAALITPGAFLFANIPAFGDDAVFGEVFPIFLPSWRDGRRRAARPSDHSRSTRAGSPCTVTSCGRRRSGGSIASSITASSARPAIEMELHRIYDWYFDTASPARRSFYVFTKAGGSTDRAGVLAALSRVRVARCSRPYVASGPRTDCCDRASAV